MIRQLQLLYETFDMSEHLVETLIRVLRGVDTNNLYLVELMQAVQATDILAVRASLTAEASRISATLDRQILFIEDLVAEDVGHRNLCCRNEIEVVEVAMVHLTLFVRQLTRAVTGCLIDNIRWLHLQITGLAGLIEEESLHF